MFVRLFKLALTLLFFAIIIALVLYRKELFSPRADELKMAPIAQISTPTNSPSSMTTNLAVIEPSLLPTISPSPSGSGTVTPSSTAASSASPTPSPTPTIFPPVGGTPPVVIIGTPPVVGPPGSNPTPSPCKPIGWLTRLFHPGTPPASGGCRPNPQPTINPTPTPSPGNCGSFGWLLNLFGFCPPQPPPTPPASGGSPSPTANPTTSPSSSPPSCSNPKTFSVPTYRPWWAFWLPKTILIRRCPPPSPSPKPSPTIQPTSSPEPSPSDSGGNEDIIRLDIDTGSSARNDDISFDPIHKAKLYIYDNPNQARLFSTAASLKAIHAKSGHWTVDFKANDVKSGSSEIPTGYYCAELQFRFRVGSATSQTYKAATYVSFSDREQSAGQVGVFYYDTKQFGLKTVYGLEFKEPTAGQNIFCPTNFSTN